MDFLARGRAIRDLPVVAVSALTTQQHVDTKFMSIPDQNRLFMREVVEALREGDAVYTEGDPDNPKVCSNGERGFPV